MFTIHSIGDSAFLAQILNALAMICGTGDFSTLVGVGMVIGLFVIGFQCIMSGTKQFNLHQVLLGFVCYMCFFGPSVTVTIEDAYTDEVRTVDNVPIGAGVAGSLISNIGYGVTALFEQGFSPADRMTEHAFMEPLKTLTQVRAVARDSSILNAVSHSMGGNFGQDLRNYLQECTMVKVALGNVSAPEVYSSGLDILKFDSDVYGTFISSKGAGGVTCKDAYPYIKAGLEALGQPEAMRALNRLLNNSTQGQVSETSTKVDNALQMLNAAGYSGVDYIKTAVIEPVFEKAVTGFYKDMGDTSAAIMVNQGIEQRNLQWAAEGSMFISTIRPLMAFFEGFIFAITPFMGFLMVMGVFGLTLVTKYFQVVIWIQLWMPVLSIINLYINMTSSNELAHLSTGAMSFYTLNTTTQALQTWLGVGGMLAAATPMIALFLVTGSTYAFTALAGRLGGADHVNERIGSPDALKPASYLQQADVFKSDAVSGTSGVGFTAPQYSLGKNLKGALSSIESDLHNVTDSAIKTAATNIGRGEMDAQTRSVSESTGQFLEANHQELFNTLKNHLVSEGVINGKDAGETRQAVGAMATQLAAGLGSNASFGIGRSVEQRGDLPPSPDKYPNGPWAKKPRQVDADFAKDYQPGQQAGVMGQAGQSEPTSRYARPDMGRTGQSGNGSQSGMPHMDAFDGMQGAYGEGAQGASTMDANAVNGASGSHTGGHPTGTQQGVGSGYGYSASSGSTSGQGASFGGTQGAAGGSSNAGNPGHSFSGAMPGGTSSANPGGHGFTGARANPAAGLPKPNAVDDVIEGVAVFWSEDNPNMDNALKNTKGIHGDVGANVRAGVTGSGVRSISSRTGQTNNKTDGQSVLGGFSKGDAAALLDAARYGVQYTAGHQSSDTQNRTDTSGLGSDLRDVRQRMESFTTLKAYEQSANGNETRTLSEWMNAINRNDESREMFRDVSSQITGNAAIQRNKIERELIDEGYNAKMAHDMANFQVIGQFAELGGEAMKAQIAATSTGISGQMGVANPEKAETLKTGPREVDRGQVLAGIRPAYFNEEEHRCGMELPAEKVMNGRQTVLDSHNQFKQATMNQANQNIDEMLGRQVDKAINQLFTPVNDSMAQNFMGGFSNLFTMSKPSDQMTDLMNRGLTQAQAEATIELRYKDDLRDRTGNLTHAGQALHNEVRNQLGGEKADPKAIDQVFNQIVKHLDAAADADELGKAVNVLAYNDAIHGMSRPSIGDIKPVQSHGAEFEFGSMQSQAGNMRSGNSELTNGFANDQPHSNAPVGGFQGFEPYLRGSQTQADLAGQSRSMTQTPHQKEVHQGQIEGQHQPLPQSQAHATYQGQRQSQHQADFQHRSQFQPPTQSQLQPQPQPQIEGSDNRRGQVSSASASAQKAVAKQAELKKSDYTDRMFEITNRGSDA